MDNEGIFLRKMNFDIIRRGDHTGQCHEVKEAAVVGRDDPGAPLAAISPEVAEKRFTLPPGRRGRRPLHWLNLVTLTRRGLFAPCTQKVNCPKGKRIRSGPSPAAQLQQSVHRF